jgi:hypothetical protein
VASDLSNRFVYYMAETLMTKKFNLIITEMRGPSVIKHLRRDISKYGYRVIGV